VTIEDGESFGTLIEGVCGPAKDWPSFCNVDLASTISRQQNGGDYNVEYPYCIFENTESGEPVCARNNEEVTFTDDTGGAVICGCLYLNPALGGAQSTCREAEPTKPTTPPTPPVSDPSIAPTVAPETKGSSASKASSLLAVMGIAHILFFAVNGIL
jgi:hypothetical protein